MPVNKNISNFLNDKKYKKMNNMKNKLNRQIKLSIKNKVNYQLLLFSLIKIILFLQCSYLFQNKIIRKLNLNSDSEIEIIINRKGNQRILSNNFNYKPSELFINGEEQIIKDIFIYNLTSNSNKIIMKWNYTLTTCRRMFYELSNIEKINLSNFDASNVLNMDYMFYGCSSLKIIDLNNIDTSKVESMEYMFGYCTRLNTLDLSYLKTSNVKYMNYMFKNCTNLILLNVDNFDTTSVENMNYIFSDCINLRSINISNFNTSNVKNMAFYV